MSMENEGRSTGFRPFRFIAEKIRYKVLVILLGATLGTLLVAGVALFAIKLGQKTIDDVVDKKGKIVTLANEAERELLLARELEQNYLLNYKKLGFENARGEYVTKVESHIGRIGAIIDEIQMIDPANEIIINQLQVARQNLKQYGDSFQNVVALSEKRGLRDRGLVGELGSTFGALEEKMGGAARKELRLGIYAMRQAEMQYQLSSERRYITRTLENGADLKVQIEGGNFPPEDIRTSQALVDGYLSAFNKLVALDRQIQDGSRIYRSAINNIRPTLTTIVEAEQTGQETAIAAMKEQNRIVLTVVLVTTIVTLLLGVFSAFMFSRRLTLQIDKIMEMFGTIGIGDFTARAEVVSRDELGEMAQSLNAMLDNTLILIQSREERDSIQESIINLLNEISDLADGDLTVRAEVTEEITGAIADSFNNMAEQLSDVVRNVKQASSQVGDSSSEVEQVTKKLARFSEDQSAKIREAIARVEDIAGSIQEVTQSALLSAEVSSKAKNNAREGSEAVLKTNKAMAVIKENMRGTARTIKRLGESSQEINNIIQLINDIADRTSILALNASIQAAMAGEAGRGFAVVAEEVQHLAERSAESTKQIEKLISGIQGEISEAGVSMEKSIQYVVEGTELADEAFTKLGEIEYVSNQLAEIIESISERARQQSQESQTITGVMHEVGVLTSRTTDATKETTVSMEKIAATSRKLAESIAVFRLETETSAA